MFKVCYRKARSTRLLINALIELEHNVHVAYEVRHMKQSGLTIAEINGVLKDRMMRRIEDIERKDLPDQHLIQEALLH